MREYRPHFQLDPPVDPTRCRYSVAERGRGVRFYQCQRKATTGKWCKQHHPDAIEARKVAAEKRWEAELARRKKRGGRR